MYVSGSCNAIGRMGVCLEVIRDVVLERVLSDRLNALSYTSSEVQKVTPRHY